MREALTRRRFGGMHTAYRLLKADRRSPISRRSLARAKSSARLERNIRGYNPCVFIRDAISAKFIITVINVASYS